MNEFIVWDDIQKLFYDNKNSFYEDTNYCKYVLVDGEVKIYVEDEYEPNMYYPYKEKGKLVPLFYIGLKDINGKKIYADCSIVEFDDEVKSKAYVRMRNFAYAFYFFESSGYTKICDFNLEKTKFKIIDTIQENKLGLIKGLINGNC